VRALVQAGTREPSRAARNFNRNWPALIT
jgi:hypothetical protein